jgi:hypothetical protein
MDAISTHKAARQNELDELLAEKAALYLGDFDAWLRGEDPDNVAYVHELIQSIALARVLTRAEREGRLEARWVEVWRDVQEEYAQAASWDRERGLRPYADRRGW